jgi:hypothetical protein
VKERFRQFMAAYRSLREVDSRSLGYLIFAAMVGILVGVGIGSWVGVWAMPVFALIFALLAVLVTLNVRLQKAQYRVLHGQPGASAAVLQSMRGQWFVNPFVALNAKQDMVHRIVGRCGIVLVGEGAHQRVQGMLAKEESRLRRALADVPVHTFICGDGPGEVPLKKLQSKLTKLPKKLKNTEVPRLERKLKPFDKTLPIPKGIDPMVVNRRRPKPR